MSKRAADLGHHLLYVDTFTSKASVDVRTMILYPTTLPITSVTVQGVKYDNEKGYFVMENIPEDGSFVTVDLWDGDSAVPRGRMLRVKHIDTSKMSLAN